MSMGYTYLKEQVTVSNVASHAHIQCCQSVGFCPKSQDFWSTDMIIIIGMLPRIFLQHGSTEHNTFTNNLRILFLSVFTKKDRE